MKTFALFGIDKYEHERLLAVIKAESLQLAASRIGGKLTDAGPSDRPRFQTHVPPAQFCGEFTAGNCTDEMLANITRPDADGDATRRLWAYYRYGTNNVYTRFIMTSVPSLE